MHLFHEDDSMGSDTIVLCAESRGRYSIMWYV